MLPEPLATACPEFDRAALPTIESLPLQIPTLPNSTRFPEFTLSQIWLLEVGIPLLMAMVLFVIWFMRGRTKRDAEQKRGSGSPIVARVFRPERTHFDHTLLAFALVLLVIALAHGYSTQKAEKFLQSARESFSSNRIENAKVALSNSEAWANKSPMRILKAVDYTSAIARVPYQAMRETVGTESILEAIFNQNSSQLRNSLDFFSNPEGLHSKDAQRAVLVAWSFLAKEELEQKRTAEALMFAEKAFSYAKGSLKEEVLEKNLCRAKFHRVVAGIDSGIPESVTQEMYGIDRLTCEFDDELRVLLRTYYARVKAQKILEGKRKPDTESAVAVLREAHAYSEKFGHPLPYITCDLVAALDVHALALLGKERAKDAVAILDQSDALIPGRDFIHSLRPQALLMWAYLQINKQDYFAAIEILNRALAETLEDNKPVLEAFILAYQSLGAKAQSEGNLDEAIKWFDKAYEINPSDLGLQNNLGQVHMQRGEKLLKQGIFDRAKSDYQRVSQVSVELKGNARMILDSFDQGYNRLQELNGIPDWIHGPKADGMLPKDTNGDGRADMYAFFPRNVDTPIAYGERQTRGRVFVTDTGGKVTALIRDHDGSGNYDERTDYGEENASQMLVDIDEDARPDVQRLFQDKESFTDKALSGRISMVMESGVIVVSTDPFNKPDAYVKFFKNRYYLGRTDEDPNSNFPIWNQGVVIDYKHGDMIELQVWDKDLIYDDLIDVYQVESFPESGTYKFFQRKAAIKMVVSPSTLDEGHRVSLNTPIPNNNIFRDFPSQVPEFGDMIAGAYSAERAVQLRKDMAIWVSVNILIPRLFPIKNFGGQMMRDIISEQILKSVLE